MVLRAAGALSRLCCFQFGNDLVDRRSSALDGLRDGTTAQRPKSSSVSSEIHLWNGNVFPLYVAPDIYLGPIEQRLDANMFSFGGCGYELAPEFRRLILVVPFKLRVARRKISLLRASWIFVAPNARDQRVPFVLCKHLLQGYGL